jgi:hypothetical protein
MTRLFDGRQSRPVAAFAALSIALTAASPASAESCTKSRDYILEGLAGELLKPAATYRNLFRICTETLALANVTDAYVLKDGGIAIIPASNTIIATAEALAEFCQRFPNSVATFLTLQQNRRNRAIGMIVSMPSSNSTSCKTIRGAS